MIGNDLSNAPTYRYYVISDAVFRKSQKLEQEQGFFRRYLRHKVTWMPDLAALAHLWKFSEKHGVRLELVFVGDDARDAVELWETLDEGSANPFSDWVGFESHKEISRSLAFRPDLLGVVDVLDRVAMYGGKGINLESLV